MRVTNALSFLAALTLAGTALAQGQTASPPSGASQGAAESGRGPAQPSERASGPSAASSPHQRAVTSAKSPEATPNENPNPTGASSPHQRKSTRLAEAGRSGAVTSGMTVEDSSGQSMGTVSDVLQGKSHHRGYVIVGGTSGSATPIPYGVARSMSKEGKIVVDRSTFDNAPKVQQSEITGAGERASWHKKVDSYWHEHRMSRKHGE